MERYEAYKDSGVEWLGEIPVGWEVKRFRYVFDLITDKAGDKLLKIGLENIESGSGKFVATDNEFEGDGIHFLSGDILFGKLRPYLAKVYLADFRGKAVGDFFVFRSKGEIKEQFGAKLISSKRFIDITNSSTYGSKMPRVSWDFISELLIAYPNLEEQTAIANFLDRKTAEIDALIAQKERLLELYEEERTAIINHAVTKGLDPDTELKDSGVEWLGEISDGWDELPLKRVSDVVLGKMLCSEDKGGYHEKPYLRAKNVMCLKVDQDDIKKMWFSSNELSQYRLEAGDLLVSEGGEVGRTCIWNNEIDECYIQNSVHRVRFRVDKDSRYYLYLFYCLGKIGVFDAIVNRISIAHLTKEKLQQVLILKPGYNQQTAIANFLDRKMTEIDAKIAKTQRIIELQKEYRTALISEVVTGKIKVPELPTQEASA